MCDIIVSDWNDDISCDKPYFPNFLFCHLYCLNQLWASRTEKVLDWPKILSACRTWMHDTWIIMTKGLLQSKQFFCHIDHYLEGQIVLRPKNNWATPTNPCELAKCRGKESVVIQLIFLHMLSSSVKLILFLCQIVSSGKYKINVKNNNNNATKVPFNLCFQSRKSF